MKELQGWGIGYPLRETKKIQNKNKQNGASTTQSLGVSLHVQQWNYFP